MKHTKYSQTKPQRLSMIRLAGQTHTRKTHRKIIDTTTPIQTKLTQQNKLGSGSLTHLDSSFTAITTADLMAMSNFMPTIAQTTVLDTRGVRGNKSCMNYIGSNSKIS